MDYYEVKDPSGEVKDIDRLSRWEGKWHKAYNRKPGFHLPHVNPNLEAQYGKTFLAPQNEPILLPLCGKTIDLIWLSREKGHKSVWGVEGVRKAIEELKEDYLPELRCVEQEDSSYDLWTTTTASSDDDHNSQLQNEKTISIICNDFFEISPTKIASSLFGSAFDRGALVAVAPHSRGQYVTKLDSLLRPGGQILLVTVARRIADDDVGPPFSITPNDVNNLFGQPYHYNIQLVGEHETDLKGEDATEFVFVLTKQK
mmetsp:Transcript_32468/g.48946  ORF Transcript_32468/g.48946 Transcript_32468/m.48946 type:complete len:257 (+) Transcript_32468:71-841(+)